MDQIGPDRIGPDLTGPEQVGEVSAVYDRFYQPLLAQVYGMLGELTEAQDVVHDAFVQAVREGERFQKLDSPEAWLRTVAVNLVRARWRRQILWRRFAGLRHAEERARTVPGLSADHVALVAALQRLSPRLREVVVLFYLVDQPLEAVCQALNIPPGTAKSRLSRGRAALAELLSDDITLIPIPKEAGHV